MTKWKQRVREIYDSLEELKRHDEIYRVVSRLGYQSAEELWRCDPLLTGSVLADDYAVAAPEANAKQVARSEAVLGSENLAFDELELSGHHDEGLAKWIEKGELCGLIDEVCGGVIGYIHRVHLPRIVGLLNAAVSEQVADNFKSK